MNLNPGQILSAILADYATWESGAPIQIVVDKQDFTLPFNLGAGSVSANFTIQRTDVPAPAATVASEPPAKPAETAPEAPPPVVVHAGKGDAPAQPPKPQEPAEPHIPLRT